MKNEIHKTKVHNFYFYRKSFSLRMINFRHINNCIQNKNPHNSIKHAQISQSIFKQLS